MITLCKKLLTNSGVESIILANEANLAYFTGYANGDSFLVIDKNACYYITDDRYIETAERLLTDFTVVSASKKLLYIKNLIKESKTIGVEGSLPLDAYLTLTDKNNEKKFSIITDNIHILRGVKTSTEIDNIKQAISIAERAFSLSIKKLYTGITEKEFCRILENNMFELGAESTSFETIIAFGENSSVPHHKTSNRALSPNEPILIDYGCKIKGYCSDITRTIAYGSLDSEFKNVYNIVRTANDIAFLTIKTGAICSDVDFAARSHIDATQYKGTFIHSLGHGIGLDIHETPTLSKSDDTQLVDGNVVTLEGGIYLKGKFGIRIEDDVVIDGVGKKLTTLTRDLIEIDIKNII